MLSDDTIRKNQKGILTMLIDFTMKNFKSFKDETTLSLETGERLSKFRESNTISIGKISLLKNLLIFGPNGSGKSNLLDGLKLMQTMVTQPPQTVNEKLIANNFKLNDESQKKDVFFEVIFKRGVNIYKYSFAFNKTKITRETLAVLNKNNWKIYFSRENQEFDVKIANFSDVENRTNENRLFIFDAQLNNDKYAIDVFKWFSEDLIFVGDFTENDHISQMAEILKTPKLNNQFLKFLHFADFNINGLEVVEEPLSYFYFLDAIEKPKTRIKQVNRIYTKHKIYDNNGDVIGTKKFRLEEESRGTQKIFMIALAFLNAELNNNGKTILFDEFDDSLHLELSQAMVKIFNSQANQNQFIITTHELQLLDSDVRVDQIYLVQKDFQGESNLISIFDFKDTKNTTRSGISYMKRYIQGRFGATPIIDSDEMLEALTQIQSDCGEIQDGEVRKGKAF
ncbi:AAA family ATPase [Companilactobacillus futsaii]|nr:ATP-binding protein [Companilactobacillus futsaii]KRK95272.1 abortive phage resistance protein [Companilactobacillus futsaii JCM 17355]